MSGAPCPPVSKKLTRLPGEERAPDPNRGRKVLRLRPRRTVETWKVSAQTVHVVVTHPKAFGPLEGKLARALKGPRSINRQLDEFGSLIWQLCDGEHTVEQIARALEDKFRERFEPAMPRTLRFVELLAERRLLIMARDEEPVEGGESA